MQFRLFAGLVVFMGSYLPLSMILLAQDYDYTAHRRPLCLDILRDDRCDLPFGTPIFSVTIFTACLICFLVTLLTLRAVRPHQHNIVLTEVRYVPSELMNYTLPYVVSFMNLNYEETGTFVGFIIFLAWMFWITYKSGQLIMNPLLIVFGWRHYEIAYKFPGAGDVHRASALVKGLISPSEHHRFATLQDVVIIKAGTDGGA